MRYEARLSSQLIQPAGFLWPWSVGETDCGNQAGVFNCVRMESLATIFCFYLVRVVCGESAAAIYFFKLQR
jgi:hypothetical protein